LQGFPPYVVLQIKFLEGLIHVTFRKAHRIAFLGVCFSIAAFAQAPIQPVQWRASLTPETAVKPGSRVSIVLASDVQEGWHVYALTQPSDGPIPLRITLDENDVAQLSGKVSGTTPVKRHDPSFEQETELYQQSFACICR
jgi:DsbC/DsbD-like thiol-disulfide interchange protein